MEANILQPNTIEYFAAYGEVFFVKNREILPFRDLPCSDALALRRELEKNSEALKAIEKVISDPTDQLRQFAACRFGKLNNTPDFINGRVNDCEATCTSCSETCRFDHKICIRPEGKYGKPTPREIEIACLVAGNTNKEIANRLNISVNTVVTHIAHLLEKIGGHSRSFIVHWSVSNNLL
ncbi:MAG: response regulator transcription factor [Bacteroidales bacterium]